MANRIRIGDFVRLTGSTLKTVIYYEKIGLLREPVRSSGGYRLYGPAELTRMQVIKRLKYLGLDLKRIKKVLGDMYNRKTLQEVLQSLQVEFLSEKKSIEERIAKIEKLLDEDKGLLDEDSFISPSFQMITEILGSDQLEQYTQTCPELFEQQRKVHSILDDFRWGEDYRETFRALAEFFRTHPKQYQTSLGYGIRLARLAQLPEDDPEVEALARESAEFIKSIPELKEILCKRQEIRNHLSNLYNDMMATVISPAQVKHGQLLQKHLSYGDLQNGD